MAKDTQTPVNPYEGKSNEELLQLLQQKDQELNIAVDEVRVLSLQKDKNGLPVIEHKGKQYQASVHSATIPVFEGEVLDSTKVVEVAKATNEEKEELIKKGLLVEIK